MDGFRTPVRFASVVIGEPETEQKNSADSYADVGNRDLVVHAAWQLIRSVDQSARDVARLPIELLDAIDSLRLALSVPADCVAKAEVRSSAERI